MHGAQTGWVLVCALDAKGIVSEWRVGLRPQADYTEGCESDPG